MKVPRVDAKRVFVPVRKYFLFCFHPLSRFLNGVVFRLEIRGADDAEESPRSRVQKWMKVGDGFGARVFFLCEMG
jgi:hypothetical protein